MNKVAAESLGLQALAFIASDSDRLGALMGVSGLGPDDLQTRITEPEFLGFVLDFMLQDDALTQEFVEETKCDQQAPLTARAMLPGGDAVHWT